MKAGFRGQLFLVAMAAFGSFASVADGATTRDPLPAPTPAQACMMREVYWLQQSQIQGLPSDGTPLSGILIIQDAVFAKENAAATQNLTDIGVRRYSLFSAETPVVAHADGTIVLQKIDGSIRYRMNEYSPSLPPVPGYETDLGVAAKKCIGELNNAQLAASKKGSGR